ncbi:MAG: sulfotransferase family protein [Lysobacter sp.]|nr:MAG: sulfotransferase family protein [Lysobacter sp.]
MSNKQQALWQQGQRHTERKQWRQAAAAYEALLEHDPTVLPAWLELSSAEEALDGYRKAYHAVLRAARIDGAPPMAGMAVARRLRRFEAIPEFLAYIERTNLPARVPPEKLIDLASFLTSAGVHDKPLTWIEHALKLRPNLPEAHNLHGLVLMFAGRSQESAAAFERALALRPHYAAVYSVLSRVANIGPDHHHVDRLRELLTQPGLSAKDEGHLAYALHNELHELGDVDGAWDALMRGCRARRQEQPFDPVENAAMFDALRRVFDAAFVRETAPNVAAPGDPTPIFIVGLHRSGTTLLERILSGHPDVADAGETYTFTTQLRYAADHFCKLVTDRTIVERAPNFDYAAIARGFLTAMRTRSRGRAFVTEKQNPNFIVLGPIAKALPQARLLHMRRDPADTCFSNLRTLFTHEAGYSYDPVQMADYCKAYRDLMAHWREAMPDRVFDIDYDAMVQDPDGQARRIVAHCGLADREETREDMLRVERRSGMVATASSNQVRQGILTNRGGVWKRYERHLGPMLDRLAAHGLA